MGAVFELVLQRLHTLTLLPELRTALQHMVAHDSHRLARNQHWAEVIPTLQRLFGGDDAAIAPFAIAWCLLYAATVRLDQLQDGDPIDDSLYAADPPAVQYNLVFSYYLLASHILDELSPTHIPTQRIIRLRSLWSRALLRMASGQQRDLVLTHTLAPTAPLISYQELAQFKTGAAFALAFGGVAALYSDDLALVEAMGLVGEIYGTLLQYSDDLIDDVKQPNQTLTLPRALQHARPDLAGQSKQVGNAFWSHLYQAHYAAASATIAILPTTLQEGISVLLRTTFGEPRAS